MMNLLPKTLKKIYLRIDILNELSNVIHTEIKEKERERERENL